MIKGIFAMEDDQGFDLLEVDNTNVEFVVDTDLADTIIEYNELETISNSIEVADNVIDDLGQYSEIVSQPDVSDEVLEVVTIAVESLKKSVGFKNHKLATEKYTSKKMALEEGIKDTIKKIWNGILNAFKNAWKSLKKFFAGLFDRNTKMRNKLNNLAKAYRSLDAERLANSDKVIKVRYPNISGNNKNVNEQIKVLIHITEMFTHFKEEGEYWIKNRLDKGINPPTESIFNYKFGSTTKDGVVKFILESSNFEWVEENINVKDIKNPKDIADKLDAAVKSLDKFIVFTKDRNDSIKEVEESIVFIEKTIKNDVDDESKVFYKHLFAIEKSKLDFYTHFLPKLNKELYSLFSNIGNVTSSIYNQIK